MAPSPGIRLLSIMATGLAALLVACSTPRQPTEPRLAVETRTTTNPLTGGAWQASDGKEMPFSSWLPANGQPRAILICVHGMSGAASDFWYPGQQLSARGTGVFAINLRGQGLDPDKRRQGDISSANQWSQDLAEFHGLVQECYPGRPVFWLGESLGSLIVLDTATGPWNARPRGLVMVSPVAGLRMPPPAWQLDLLRLASRLCPTWRISLEAMATKGQPMQVTETTTHQEQMAKTPHYVPRLSLRLLRETGRLMKSAPLRASQWTGPVLVLFTANDPVSSREQVENLLGFFKKDGVAALFLPKSFHLIFHDKEHATAVRELARWLEAWKN